MGPGISFGSESSSVNLLAVMLEKSPDFSTLKSPHVLGEFDDDNTHALGML